MAAALAVWGGLALGAGLAGEMVVALLAISALSSWLALRAPARVGTVALLLALGGAAAARAGAHHLRLGAERVRVADDAPPSWIEARVLEPPLRESGEPQAVVGVLRAGNALARGTRLKLRLPPGCEAEWSDHLVALARIEIPAGQRNPGGFDSRAAAEAAGIAATGRALVARVTPERGPAAWPRATAARWRRAIEKSLTRGLSPSARELALPLVIGDRSALPTELDAAFRASGLVHLLALSGLHVAWLAAVARVLAAALGAGVRGRALAGGACALLYGALAGPLPSLMRAVATELTLAAARLLGRALDPVQALALSAVLLLAAAPGWAGDLGFQLSCAATLGLVTVGPQLARLAGSSRLRQRLIAPLLPTVSAQLTAAPVLMSRLHAISWVGGLANLAAVPVSGLLLAAAWLGAVVDLALPGAGALPFGACEILSTALRWIAGWAAGVPTALIATGHEPGASACAFAGAALLALSLPAPRTLAARAEPPSRARLLGIGLGALASGLAVVLALGARPIAPPPGRWWLVALDVGQGDALALGFEDGWWLVDTGPRSPRHDAGESVVLPFLRWAAVRRLETLVLTHDDGDHTGGAAAVLRALPVARRLASPALPGVPGPALKFGAATAARGETLRHSPTVAVLWPPRAGAAEDSVSGFAALAKLGDNAGSLVLEVGGGAGRALLLADAPAAVEESLVVAPGVALLKVGHHGSATSSSAGFLARARPRLAVIPVGRHNAFGHPDPGVLARLRESGAAVRRTDQDGAVWLECSSEGVRVIEWRAGEPRPTLGTERGFPSAPRQPAP